MLSKILLPGLQRSGDACLRLTCHRSPVFAVEPSQEHWGSGWGPVFSSKASCPLTSIF